MTYQSRPLPAGSLDRASLIRGKTYTWAIFASDGRRVFRFTDGDGDLAAETLRNLGSIRETDA